MDFLEIAFASYIEMISNSLHSAMTDRIGTEVQARVVEYDNQKISYSYQIWKIQPKSVCGIYSGDFLKKSKCSQAAKRMFNEICLYLQDNPQKGWRYTKTKNMYCKAATSYDPIVANVTFNTKNENQKNKEKCSIATLKVTQSASKKNLKEKDEACGNVE